MKLTLSDLSPGQRYHVLSSLVVPRPIAWVTTLNEDGQVNAAPFSYFQLMGENPPLVVLGIGKRHDGSAKDSFRNIRRTREFVINIVTEENAELMNLCATDFPPGVSEVGALGLATEPSSVVKPPRLSVAPAQLEAFRALGDGLREALVVSSLHALTAATDGTASVHVMPAAGEKCERCWKYLPLGADTNHPTLCAPCAQIVTDL